MNDDSIVGSVLSQLGGVAKATAKQISKLPSEAAEGVEKQIAGEVKDKDTNARQDQSQAVDGSDSKKQTEEVVKSFYETSDDAKKSNLDEKTIEEDEFRKQIKDKSPEEQKKLLELRQQLHKQTYYDPTFNPQKKQEERPQEKIEKEEKEKKQMQALELQKEEKKKEELSPAAKQGTHEKYPGASG